MATITKEKFQAYIKVQESGVTNMFNVPVVISLSKLTKEECLDIMQNYGTYKKKFDGKVEEAETDTRTKVLNAFKKLRKRNYICRANYLCCTSCANYGLTEMAKKRKEKGKEVNGYAYWHSQNEDDFRKNGELWLGYSGVDQSSQTAAEIIVQILSKEGLTVEWDGSSDTKIFVK